MSIPAKSAVKVSQTEMALTGRSIATFAVRLAPVCTFVYTEHAAKQDFEYNRSERSIAAGKGLNTATTRTKANYTGDVGIDCETNQELQVRMYGTQIHANTFDSPRPFWIIVPCVVVVVVVPCCSR